MKRSCGRRRQLLFKEYRAGHVVCAQRIFDDGTEQPAFARVRADVGVCDLLGIDQAADNKSGANASAGLNAVARGRDALAHKRADRPLRASRDDFDAPGDLARICVLAPEAVVVWLARLRPVRIAQFDDATGTRGRRLGRSGEHDGNGIPRLDAKSEGGHRMSSFTSSNGIVRSAKPNVPRLLSSLAMSRTSASDARIGPEPTLTRATPSASSSETGGVPLTARIFTGPAIP